jgi:hypothetical protein
MAYYGLLFNEWMRNSVYNTIKKSIQKAKKGSLIFPVDFKGLADRAVIHKVLSRLDKEGIIKRLARGIYAIPKYDPLLGLLYPNFEEIAQAIAQRNHVRIQTTGSYALNRLGLCTQVPTNPVYLTDGTARKIKIGKATIKFKKVAAKKFLRKGPISSLVIQALEELRQGAVTPEIQKKLKELLKHETEENLINDFKFAPAWIRKLVFVNTDSSQ